MIPFAILAKADCFFWCNNLLKICFWKSMLN